MIAERDRTLRQPYWAARDLQTDHQGAPPPTAQAVATPATVPKPPADGETPEARAETAPGLRRVRPPERGRRNARALLRPAAVAGGGLALLVQLALRERYLRRAPFVVDELEHLHGAFLASNGATPYSGFFEHHPPLYYLGLGRLLPGDPGLSTLTAVRVLAASVSLLTMALVIWWARRLGGQKAMAVTAILAVTNVFWLFTGTLAFLDTFAGLLLVIMASALCPTTERFPTRFRLRSTWRAVAAGAALGAGMLISQKLFLAASLPAVATLAGWRRHGFRRTARLALAGLAGLLVVAALVGLWLGPAGVRGYWRDTWALNFRWKARHRPSAELRDLLRSGGPVYVLGSLAAAIQLVGLARRRFRLVPADLVAVAIGAYGLGTLVLPVVWPEYFVSFVPFLVLMAGLAITALGNRWNWGRAPLHIAGQPITTPLRLVGTAIAVIAFAALPFAKQLGARHADNSAQRARIAFVLAATNPGDTVFDSYTGYGVFRPDAYRYWFLHDEVQLMLSDEQKGADVVAAIRARRPALYFTDRYTDSLPAEVRAELARVAMPTVFDDIWCRKDLAARCAAAASGS